MSTTTITRRAALTGSAAGAAAIVAGTIPALAVQPSDEPIFEAIEAHRAAMERHEAAVRTQSRLENELPADKQHSYITAWDSLIVFDDDPRWIAAIRELRDASEVVDDLAWDIVERTPLNTAAGVAALIAYADCEHYGTVREGWFPDGWTMEAYCLAAKTSMRLAGGVA